jgi:hypothetical protein
VPPIFTKKKLMKSRMFGVELDLTKMLQTDFLADTDQVEAFIGDLSLCYNEVVVLRARKHVYILVVGSTLDPLAELLLPFIHDNRMINVSLSPREAIGILMKIAKGERWKDVSLGHIRTMIYDGAQMALESGMLGEDLRTVLGSAWNANGYSGGVYQNMDQLILNVADLKYPTIHEFDLTQLPMN